MAKEKKSREEKQREYAIRWYRKNRKEVNAKRKEAYRLSKQAIEVNE